MPHLTCFSSLLPPKSGSPSVQHHHPDPATLNSYLDGWQHLLSGFPVSTLHSPNPEQPF